MDNRINAGFKIIASQPIDQTVEVVFGYNLLGQQYVTWLCTNGDNYFWGHYHTDFLKAIEDFQDRCRRGNV